MTDNRLTWYERVQRTARHHQRNATRDTVIATLAAGALLAVLSLPGQAASTPELPPDDTALSAVAVGDLMFGRFVAEVVEERGPDWPFARVAPYLEAADYVTGNFEHPVVLGEGYPEAEKLIHLKTGPETVEALARANFTTLSVANNHTMDYGEPGLADTMTVFADAGIPIVGVGENREAALEILYEEYNGLEVATLGFTDVYSEGFTAQAFRGGVLPTDPDVFLPLIAEAAAEADLVVVHVHWGQEYDTSPHPRQEALGRAMADAGADLVIGHHPHVLMPVERYGDSVIFYSLGNFVFDQGWSRTRETVLARYLLAEDGTARIELVPLWVREAQPRPLDGPTAGYRRARIGRALSGYGVELEREDGVFAFTVDHRHVVEGAADGR